MNLQLRIAGLVGFAIAASLTAACRGHVSGAAGTGGSIDFDGGYVVLRASGHPAARVAADGALSIADRAVALSADQQAQLVTLYGAAQAIKAHGIETGKAGAAVGLAAASEAIGGIASGDTSQVGARVEAKADEVRRAAAKICSDLAAVRSAEIAVAATLAAFRPYLSIASDEVERCTHDTQPKAGG